MGRLASILVLSLLLGSLCSQPALARKVGKDADSSNARIRRESTGNGEKDAGQPSQDGMAGLVSASLAEVLMIPSLTKEQQTKIRNLYLEYRPRSLKTWHAMEKFNRGGRMAARKPTVGSEILAGLVSSKESAQKHMEREESASKMDAFDSGMKRQMFGNLVRDWVVFTRDVLAVLTKEQRKELRAIGMKTGAPDYFVKNQADLEKFAKFGMMPD